MAGAIEVLRKAFFVCLCLSFLAFVVKYVYTGRYVQGFLLVESTTTSGLQKQKILRQSVKHSIFKYDNKTTSGLPKQEKLLQSANYSSFKYDIKVEVFPAWTTRDPEDNHLTYRVYLYSAIFAIHRVPPAATDVHLVSIKDAHTLLPLTCCLKLGPHQPGVAMATAVVDYLIKPKTKNPRNVQTVGVVYRCRFHNISAQQLHAAHVTLTPTSCPGDSGTYLRVHDPERRPGGLAVCAKIVYGHRLNVEKLVEWFEAQKLLGVDRVQLFDLTVNGTVRRVLQYYVDTGLLTLLPYKLPGRPWGRSLLKHDKDWTRYGDDKTVPIWDCRLRLAGYDYVMGLDVDEIIMPRAFSLLKPFLDDQFTKKGAQTAALLFRPQFFLDHWGPMNPSAPLLFLRYLNSTVPMPVVMKHVYKPSRTHQARTHRLRPYKGFHMRPVSPSEATIFHYRACKQNWKFSCDGPRITDTTMLRFSHELISAVAKVRAQLDLDDVKPPE